MLKTKLAPRALIAVAFAAIAAGAVAMPMPMSSDVRIVIDRAINSPTLTIRYSGASVSLVELRVNGESFATREVTGGKANGETNFNLEGKDLKDGDNEVEIRLYDRTGKLVGSDKVNVSTEQSNGGTIFLKEPKVGQTVRGAASIKVGFGTEMKSSFVSFFVDNNFKSMTNYPPYEFNWDTSKETNGWHEVEAWVVDETNNTFKTRRVRVLVNNPGGRTDRPNVDIGLKPAKSDRQYDVTGSESGIRTVKTVAKAVNPGTASAVPKGAPTVPVGMAKGNRVRANNLGGASGLKPLSGAGVLMTGVRTMTPTGKRTTAQINAAVVVKPVATKPVVVKHAITSGGVVKLPLPQATSTKPVALKATEKVVAKKPSSGVIEIKTSVASNKTLPGSAITAVKTAASAGMVSIVKGTRLPNFGRFSVAFEGRFIDFDVQPRVDSGVPMTPFRHLFEANGGKVKWENGNKSLLAQGDGKSVFIQIGDPLAKVNELSIRMETSPYLDRGRTIVPLSFLRDALAVNVDYDKATGHVLITKRK